MLDFPASAAKRPPPTLRARRAEEDRAASAGTLTAQVVEEETNAKPIDARPQARRGIIAEPTHEQLLDHCETVECDHIRYAVWPEKPVHNWLRREGIPQTSKVYDADLYINPALQSSVVFYNDRFSFAEPGDDDRVTALIFLARDENGDTVDLAAWSPRHGIVATQYGRITMLGQPNVVLSRWEPLPVWRSPLAWLRNSRRGVVIVDPGGARRLLEGCDFAPEDEAHAEEIRLALRPPEHRFFCRKIQ